MIVYSYKKRKKQEKLPEDLCKQAAVAYANEKGREVAKGEFDIIERTKNGKPYFKNSDVCFSISHSDDLWICAVGNVQVGIDIQFIKSVNASVIAKRLFMEDEISYVEENGEEGFFEIWVRKEAYVKYKGTGFAKEGFDTFSVLDSKKQMSEIIGEGEHAACVTELEIAENSKCVICSKIKEAVVVRELVK